MRASRNNVFENNWINSNSMIAATKATERVLLDPSIFSPVIDPNILKNMLSDELFFIPKTFLEFFYDLLRKDKEEKSRNLEEFMYENFYPELYPEKEKSLMRIGFNRVVKILTENEKEILKKKYPESFEEEKRRIIEKILSRQKSVEREDIKELIDEYLGCFNIYPYPINRIYQEEFLFLLSQSIILGRLKTLKKKLIRAGIAVLDCIQSFRLYSDKLKKRLESIIEKYKLRGIKWLACISIALVNIMHPNVISGSMQLMVMIFDP